MTLFLFSVNDIFAQAHFEHRDPVSPASSPVSLCKRGRPLYEIIQIPDGGLDLLYVIPGILCEGRLSRLEQLWEKCAQSNSSQLPSTSTGGYPPWWPPEVLTYAYYHVTSREGHPQGPWWFIYRLHFYSPFSLFSTLNTHIIHNSTMSHTLPALPYAYDVRTIRS